MTALYLLSLTASITGLAVLLLRTHPAPEPPTPPTAALAAHGDRLHAVSTLLRDTADQIDTYRPAA